MIRIFKVGVFPILFLVFSITRIFATPSLSGQINHYAKVLDVNGCVLTVDTATSFQKGDYVLVLQMKGGTMQHTNDNTYGTLTDLGVAGVYEQNEVVYVDGNLLYLKNEIAQPFQPNLGVQVVGIRPHQSMIVSNVTVKPWDGDKGGVLFLNAPDTISIRSNINADKKGYKGGLKSLSNNQCGIFSYEVDFASANAGQKGESFIPNFAQYAGRGAAVTAGGGGNSFNAGGAGAGHLGLGGRGGDSHSDPSDTCAREAIGGENGKDLALSLISNRMLMGAGGGGGHQNPDPLCFEQATDGGNGGGIILVSAQHIKMKDGIRLSAKGETPFDLALRDGAGGGGAGGAILLDAPLVSGQFTLDVSGGDGGSIDNIQFGGECQGPGGGGGGGRIHYNATNTLNATMVLDGGNAGLIVSSNSPCYNTSYGATNGTPGLASNDFVFAKNNQACGDYFIQANDDYYSGESPISFSAVPKANDVFSSPVSFNLIGVPVPQIQRAADTLTFSFDRYYVDQNEFDYEICLTQAPFLCDTATIHLVIDYINTPPVAINDTITIPAGVIHNLLPMLNDYDPDGDPISLQSPVLSDLYKAIVDQGVFEIQVPKPGTYTIPYEICDNQGACDQAVITIISTLSLDLEIPEGYSPNDDNINDYFEIINLEYHNQVKVTIYNRWGQVVFKDDFYANDWDGTGPNGDALPDGTYFYNVTPLNQETLTGYVIIHR